MEAEKTFNMKTTKATTDQLLHLEQILMSPEVRASAERLDALLADNFREFGSSGRSYDKMTVITELVADPGLSGTRTITDFRAELLETTVALVTYRIEESATLRSSIWILKANQWQMVFHQGTPTKTEMG